MRLMSEILFPEIAIVPFEGVSILLIHFRKVDLPAPFTPNTATNSFPLISKLILSKIWFAPQLNLRPSIFKRLVISSPLYLVIIDT